MKLSIIINSTLNSEKFSSNFQKMLSAFSLAGIEVNHFNSSDFILDCNTPLPSSLASDIFYYDKDLILAEYLTSRGYRLYNSASAIALADDKGLTYITLAPHNIAQPLTIIGPKLFYGYGSHDYSFVDRAISLLGLPLIVKESCGSLGEQVHLASSKNEIVTLINSFAGRNFILQKYLPVLGDYRLQVIGSHVVAAMQRLKGDNQIVSNLSHGGHGIKHEPTPQECDLAIRATQALGLDFAGVDIIYDGNCPLVLEVNSNAQTENISRITGIDVNSLLAKYFKNKLSNK